MKNRSGELEESGSRTRQGLSVKEPPATDRVQLTMDNGPESSGVRTHFLSRRVQLVATSGQPFPLLSSPPSHRKDTLIERWWGILEFPWNGTQRREGNTMLEWTKGMTGKGLTPLVTLSRKV